MLLEGREEGRKEEGRKEKYKGELSALFNSLTVLPKDLSEDLIFLEWTSCFKQILEIT